jgi:hypothetical protein
MTISVIRATFRCDGCAREFRVEIDPARRAWERRQDMFSIAVDALQGGVTIDGGFCSVQHDMHLCGDCTAVTDAINADDENYLPSREEIVEALERQGQ